ncbi:hypothetical protein Neosp_000151 [[Neocosmospora] mangrovei]
MVSSSGNTTLEQAAETWEIMVEQADKDTQEAKKMVELVAKLRMKMKEYCGEAKNYLDDEGDLVSLGAPIETDMLFKMLRAYWPGKEEVSRDGIHRISRFEERSITIAAALINIVIAIILLVGSITSLYFVSSPAAILGMISAFTIAFALSVGLMTNAKRAEIFAGSAAFAAVLVVFVSSGDLSGNCCQEK